MSFTLNQLALKTDTVVHGDGECIIDSLCCIRKGKPGAIGFIASAKYAKYLTNTKAEAVILSKDLVEHSPIPALVADNPRAAYARISSLLYSPPVSEAGIHPTAVIDPSAGVAVNACIGAYAVIGADVRIDKGVNIGANCVVERNCRIGENTRLYSNVTLYHDCRIGQQSIVHSGAVIGADGFGFEFDLGKWIKIQQVGGVRIGNSVEIGACSTVDRGALENTVIEDGVKLDNHVQIGHNVQVGAHTVMASGVAVAGSTKVGQNCIFGGMTGIKDGVEIADNVMVTAMSMVSKSLLKPGSYSSNTPIDETRLWRRNSARFRQLDELAKRIRQLEKEVQKCKRN
ncbi:MAG: UDP-3-O-(3-hydroxymyristoyl)glucosamine N-acyltransferase [Thiothrix sp.]|nr:MAG: UDP-3-O-(3-hydroxymyristoyl)glucosamine N-acyltransferase [Thiothrix sp.]